MDGVMDTVDILVARFVQTEGEWVKIRGPKEQEVALVEAKDQKIRTSTSFSMGKMDF